MQDNLNTNEKELNEANAEIDTPADDCLQDNSDLNETLKEESELDKLKAEIVELKDKQLRSIAEFDNFRRRTAKERLEMIQTAGKEVITDLLEVLDDSERAQNQMETNSDLASVKDGVILVFNKLRNVLKNKGLKPMETIDQVFDADLHDAITEIPATTEDQIGKIMAEVEKGYYLNEKIIRHAKVVVGK